MVGGILPHPGWAAQINNKISNVGASFLQMNPGVRSTALGTHQAAASGFSETMFSNPASLSKLSMPEIWFTHNQSFVETRHETIGFGIPLHNHGFGFAVQYMDEGKLERTGVDATNNPLLNLGQINPSTTLFNIAWAKELNKVSLGLMNSRWAECLWMLDE